MKESQKQMIKSVVRGCYDIQKLRIQTGNRITSNFKVKLGIEPGEKEENDLLKLLKNEYKRITDGVNKITKRMKFDHDGIISNFTELTLVTQYMELLNREENQFRLLKGALSEISIYTGWLEGVSGCGPAMAGVIISEIDIAKAQYPSSLWKYAGLDVCGDGKGRSRKKEHLVDQEYADSNGEIKMKKGISFNPFLKTKLVGVLGSSFLRAKSPYSEVYYNYKHRLEQRDDWKEESDGHRHNAATRYMVKVFLKDLYSVWREMEGLPASEPYEVAKLGLHNHKRVV